jgi:hypothetical protein
MNQPLAPSGTKTDDQSRWSKYCEAEARYFRGEEKGNDAVACTDFAVG